MTLHVLHPGLLTTVQDRGRHGRQHDGVPVSGAMDEVALRVANLLVGNAEGDAALECTLAGPTLRTDAPVLAALAGADLGATVDGHPVAPWRPFWLPSGATVSFRGAGKGVGCRAYLALAGGIDLPTTLGSRSTHLRAALGGLAGRALQRGDSLPIGAPTPLSTRLATPFQDSDTPVVARWSAGPSVRPRYAPPDTPADVRLLAGAHTDTLTPASRAWLLGATFRVSPRSDRMGYRLEGPPLALVRPLELLSEGVAFGTVQLPPGGAPIVLMADRQTIGGYPRVGEVAAVDLPVLAQLRPGDTLRFRAASLDDAQTLYLARERDLTAFGRAVALRARGG